MRISPIYDLKNESLSNWSAHLGPIRTLNGSHIQHIQRLRPLHSESRAEYQINPFHKTATTPSNKHTHKTTFVAEHYPAFLGVVSSIPTPFSLRTSFSLLLRIDSLSLVKEPLRFRLLSPSCPQPVSSALDQLGRPSPVART